jgi:putative transposase
MVRHRSLRLAAYDYGSPGAYFVTICTHQRSLLFEHSGFRDVATREWERSTLSRPRLELDAFVVMPNHIHGVVWLRERSADGKAQHAAPLQSDFRVVSGSLGAFIRAYKASVTREINLVRDTGAAPVWQRNYYEHIVRDDDDLSRVRQYIDDNPRRWEFDRENPQARPDDQEITFWKNSDPM